MTQPEISVIVPTVEGRLAHLERCLNAYHATTARRLEILILADYPTCGIAWQKGAERATGRYIHFTADDLEPLEGWSDVAIETVEAGMLPAPLIYQRGLGMSCGERWSPEPPPDWTPMRVTGVPFMSMDQWEKIGPMIPLHYATDNYVSYRGRLAGIDTVARPEYAFIHHIATEGRGAGMTEGERQQHDRLAYERLTGEKV
jgi:hypothetical protein